MNSYPTLTEAHAGCWFDGGRGIYIGLRVIEAAQDRGWDNGEYREGDFHTESEFYLEAWGAATDFLNSLAPEGFWLGCNESGDFGMWECEEEA